MLNLVRNPEWSVATANDLLQTLDSNAGDLI
jgi:hypothetical protein